MNGLQFGVSSLLKVAGLMAVMLSLYGPSTLVQAQERERQLLWGDTHLHSTYSSDAFTNGNLTATPDTAYHYAKGKPVVHPGHKARVQIGTPLDFLVVSDHAEYSGVIRSLYLNPMITEGLSWKERIWPRLVQYLLRDAVDNDTGRELFTTVLPKPAENAVEAMLGWEEDRVSGLVPRQPTVEVDTWKLITDAAERHNDPGVFTALIGWEYSLIPGGANLHRVVISDITAEQAQTFAPFGFDDSSFPSDLWDWLEETSRATGGDFIAVPHNSNISKGSMFDVRDLRGEAIDRDYAEVRRYWEPIVEITQIKGDSETHPVLAPGDAFADFERYPYYIQREWTDYVPQRGDYVRSALKVGLELDAKIGFNPYQFGVIGSTDAHTALPSAEADNFHGKMATDSIPSRKAGGWSEDARGTFGWGMRASGLAAVWADSNTRGDIFDAMRRKETYATTGPRMKLRFFASDNFERRILKRANMVERAYRQGVSMGSDLTLQQGQSPEFLLWAMRDARSQGLQRLQITKGWLQPDGSSAEKVFDVACAGGKSPNAKHRCPDNGAKVELKTCKASAKTSADELKVIWRDPEYSSGQQAFYYVRVMENPSCRWSSWDALRAGVAPRPDVDATIQERAYSSPIWVN